MGVNGPVRFVFGPFQLDLRAKELRRNGIKVRVPDQSIQVLAMLLEHPGEVVTREDLHLSLWPNGTIVEFDQSLNAAVRRLRQALDDSAEAPQYVETLPRTGYRFIGKVEPKAGDETPRAPEPLKKTSAGLGGEIISHYRILNKLAVGGIGIVYKAEDIRLGRTVALKFLPDLFTDDTSALERFHQEARAASALNHPNICTLYDIGQAEGRSFLAMEYLEGQTLRDRMQGKQLAMREILELSRQIADALDSAHRAGIVHRDLKPDNIAVTKSGAKLLDFGLARIRNAKSTERETAATLALNEGAASSSLQYLAPEQLEAKEEDGRTDIFALGVVMYEMITGRAPFQGSSQASVTAAILAEEPPPISTFQPETPPALEHVVRTCLKKDPEDRWQTARDVVHELKWIADATPGTEVSMPAAKRSNRREHLAWVLTAVSIAALSVALLFFRRDVPEAELVQFAVAMPERLAFDWWDYPSISPDGRHFVMDSRAEGKRMLWIRALDSVNFEPLPGTEGAYYPFWSPDSRFVAFFTIAGKLKKIDINGGVPQSLCDVPARGGGNGGTWNRNGVILFATYGAPLRRVPEGGGEAHPVLDLDRTRQELSQAWPFFLPNGRDFLYLGLSTDAEKNAICTGSLGSKQTRVLMRGISNASYAEPGFLLYGREGKLLAQPFDVKKLDATSNARVILQQVGEMPGFGATLFSVSRNGVLVYRTGGGGRTQLSEYDRNGKRLGSIGAPELYGSIVLSPDEERIAVDRIEPQTRKSNIWMVDLSTAIVSRVTFGNDSDPVWSPNSRELAFVSIRTGKPTLYRKVLGGGNETAILESDEYQYPGQWIADGQLILVTMPAGTTTFSQLPFNGSHKPVTLLKSEFDVSAPSLSPDGRWIAYDSVASGRWQVYLASFPGFSQTRQISNAGGVQPLWRKDGKELFYLSGDGRLMAVQINAGTTIESGPPQVLFQTKIDINSGPRQFCSLRDGQRFLLAEPADRIADQVVVVTNWAAGLKK